MTTNPPKKVRLNPYYNAFNVDNTADEDKPLSGPTKTYVDLADEALAIDIQDTLGKTEFLGNSCTYANVGIGLVSYTWATLPGRIKALNGSVLSLPPPSGSYHGRVVTITCESNSGSCSVQANGGSKIVIYQPTVSTEVLTDYVTRGTARYCVMYNNTLAASRWHRLMDDDLYTTQSWLASTDLAVTALQAKRWIQAYITCTGGVYSLAVGTDPEFTGVTKSTAGAITVLCTAITSASLIVVNGVFVNDTLNNALMLLNIRSKGSGNVNLLMSRSSAPGTLADFDSASGGYVQVHVYID